ncbi:unnamed protein product [Miscanthus lutarioriparius]|uniref:AP2/ERF domain-containing protein n=1 Tax=Miscanthus lutarioriparius TaxID=422564 RepID=A0A811S1I9_9POAL|nr:unnamed protein product [Miscanthus lutarioriparius]
MQGGMIELARQAAAAARAERGVRGPARLPVRRYRGVMRQGDMYAAEIMDAAGLRPVWLGSYATPEEAAYAYDAATRIMHGNKAKPNFPEPPVPYHGGAAPAFSQFMYRPAAGPAFDAAAGGSNGAGFYGPALAAAGGSNGAGFYGMAPMIGPEPEVPMPAYAARRARSSSDKKNKAAVDASATSDPKLVIIIESDSDGESVVEDNFTGDGGASSSSAARPAVLPLRLKDLMEAEVVRRSADEGKP